MCGIIGYIGDKNLVSLLVGGLKRLEYRGYDSVGMCIAFDNELKLVKEKGKISELAEKLNLEKMPGHVGIAHTRWATHGEPNKINAHPHLDCKKQIAIIHNGIIENHHPIRELLKREENYCTFSRKILFGKSGKCSNSGSPMS